MNTSYCKWIFGVNVQNENVASSDLSPTTAEVLFEVYDHAVKPSKFLGLAIVGVDELIVNPSQRQIISLQSRPYESDPVSGTLTIEVTSVFVA
jgi:hypothetical protein